MLGYICKYTPIELFESFDVEMTLMEPEVIQFNRAEALMHPNVCSYVKGVLEAFADAVKTRDDVEGMIITACCDSGRRLYDALKATYPDKFIYLLDLPRKITPEAVQLFTEEVSHMVSAYSEHTGRAFYIDGMIRPLKAYLKAHPAPLKSDRPDDDSLNVGLMGGRVSPSFTEALKRRHVHLAFDVTCSHLARLFDPDQIHKLSDYCEQLLSQFPCMRMMGAEDRLNMLDDFEDKLNGLIYHTVKFCDQYHFEGAALRKLESFSVPVLYLETDLTRQSSGQIETRLEAFLEEIKARRKAQHQKTAPEAGMKAPAPKPLKITDKSKAKGPYVLGIDSGSTSTNAVITDGAGQILAWDIVRTGAKSIASAEKAMHQVLEKAHLPVESLSRVVSTGYGRNHLPFSDQEITEITCHAKGAHAIAPSVRTILDIGGQDSKAIRLDKNGNVRDFVMNDKCAAGTGRFLEMMAHTLGVSLEELGQLSLNSKEDIRISSMCTVFAESEVISLIAQNKEPEDIAHGVHVAIAGRALTLLRRVGIEPKIMMTGGVAKNPGIVAVLEEALNQKLVIADQPEIVGAYGAALLARK
jgi:predicted CoA-substrate-specific enzyme activase